MTEIVFNAESAAAPKDDAIKPAVASVFIVCLIVFMLCSVLFIGWSLVSELRLTQAVLPLSYKNITSL
ncbi:hypothetical protein FMO003_10110 [Moritella sp. F3]|nr:hypothetical protein FMO001_03120 [Moritella sp. F1]GIC80730.1 hypothetical protein FMO003_10110 [Moritella sp. F3]